MLDKNLIKKHYKSIVDYDEIEIDHKEDRLIFSTDGLTCVIGYNAYENRMDYYIWKIALVTKDEKGIKFSMLKGYHTMPNVGDLWINNDIFCFTHLIENQLKLGIKYVDVKNMRSFKINEYPEQLSGYISVKNEHFRFVSKPTPTVFLENPFDKAYKKYLPKAKWENISVDREFTIEEDEVK